MILVNNMDKETFENLLMLYNEALHMGSFSNYYLSNLENENLQILKKLYQKNQTIFTISLKDILNEISYLEKIPLENIDVVIEVNNSNHTPPLTKEKYESIIQKNYLKQITIKISFDYLHKFDISFCSNINLNGLDLTSNPILNYLIIKINDTIEPTSKLFVDTIDIPINITLRTFDDVYYSSYSEDNLNTFYNVIINSLFKEKKHGKIKKYSKNFN